MFSPTLATVSAIASATVTLPAFAQSSNRNTAHEFKASVRGPCSGVLRVSCSEHALLGAELLRLRNPTVDAARQADLFADVVRGFRAERRDLPIVEDAKVVEL